MGRLYQQTFIDTYAKVAFAKLYDRKTPVTAADLLNDRVVPFYEAHDIKLSRVLTDRGTADLDAWMTEYNERRSHQGRWCFGKTPMQTYLDAIPLAKEKIMAA